MKPKDEISVISTREKIKNVLTFIALLILISGIFYGAIRVQDATANNANKNIVSMGGFFIDMNGDGLVDYVVSAEVIINNGELGALPNLTPSP